MEEFIARSTHRTIAVVVLLALMAIAFAVYRWRTSGFQWTVFLATFRGVDWVWLLVSILIIYATYVGRAMRWRVMVRAVRPDASLRRIIEATAIGFTAIVFFGRAGELVRPYLIANRENVPFSSQMAAWLLERVLDLLMVLLIFGIALFEVQRSGLNPGPHLRVLLEAGGFIISVMGVTCLALLLAFRYFSDRTHQRIMDAAAFLPQPVQARIDQILAAFRQGLGSTRSNAFVIELLAYSVLEWVLITACFLAVFRAFPVTRAFTPADVLIFMGFVSLGSAVQIPGVGGGMQVAAVVVLTELFGLPLESASGFAIVLWLITFVTIVPIGVALAFQEGLNWGKLSHVEEDVGS